jgi:hypothetical protein
MRFRIPRQVGANFFVKAAEHPPREPQPPETDEERRERAHAEAAIVRFVMGVAMARDP